MGEWDEGFDEWQGVVTIEVQMAVRATSGRPKHTDPVEQGTWVANAVQGKLREVFADADDVMIGTAKLLGHREEHWADWNNRPRTILGPD